MKASQVVEPVTRWRLDADQRALDRLAHAWALLGVRANEIADGVTLAANKVYGPHWQAEAADKYHAHRKRITERIDGIGQRARAAGDIVAGAAGTIAAAQGHLADSLRRAGTVARATESGAAIVFEVATEEARAAVVAEVRQAIQIRNDLTVSLRADATALRDLCAEIRKLAVSPTEAEYGGGFRLAAGETPDTSVLAVDKQVIVNTGSGNDNVEVRPDPKNPGGLIIDVNGVEYPIAAGMEPVIRTGEGNDVVRVAAGTKVNLTILGGAGDDELGSRGANDLGGGGDGDNSYLGGRGNDVIHAGAGTNYASGGAGRDYIEGGLGADILRGGLGNDTIYGLDGRDRLAGGADLDYLDGGAGSDTLSGGAGNDILFGGRDVDRLVGGAGDDRAYSGHGADRVDLGSGNDTGHLQADDTASGAERVVRVEYQPHLGQNFIQVTGSPEFVARVESDIEALRSIPGQAMLKEFERINTTTARSAGGAPLYTGDHLEIVEVFGPYETSATYQDNAYGRTYIVKYDPTLTMLPDGRGETVPVAGLYHEGGHIHQFANDSFPPGETVQSDGSTAPNYERAVVGLEPGQPEELTQNWLYRLFGRPERPIY
jgi:Ca2+-binding RTX toxin-like protein